MFRPSLRTRFSQRFLHRKFSDTIPPEFTSKEVLKKNLEESTTTDDRLSISSQVAWPSPTIPAEKTLQKVKHKPCGKYFAVYSFFLVYS